MAEEVLCFLKTRPIHPGKSARRFAVDVYPARVAPAGSEHSLQISIFLEGGVQGNPFPENKKPVTYSDTSLIRV